MREEVAVAAAAAHANDVVIVVDYRQSYRFSMPYRACRSVDEASQVLLELHAVHIDYLYLGHYLCRGPDVHLTNSAPIIAMLADGAAEGTPWKIGQIRLTAGSPYRAPMRARLESAGYLVRPDMSRG